jgi:aerotaxis receptor
VKQNLPVTDNEIKLEEGQELISTTDLKGSITSYNDDFLRMSGFSDDELMDKNHNVIRHPDMPVEAFADLWKHMQSNQHWMGVVKNRAKSGDHYWVDAYITPIVENGQVLGYESVRAKPTDEQVSRAETVYKQLQNGQQPKLGSFVGRMTLKQRTITLNIVSMLFAVMAFLFTPEIFTGLPLLMATILGIGSFITGAKWAFLPLENAVKKAHQEVNNPLMSLIYTGRSDEIGQLLLPSVLQRAKLRTILGRINHAAEKININAASSAESLANINGAVKEQASETDLVATAMTEMSASVQEVASSAAFAASKAEDAGNHSKEGVAFASDAADGIQGLNVAVENIAEVVTRLDVDTQNIGVVIDVIKSIAEQTNLLALNAAIEAARAGEQGRGFAVVADEVRTLAGRTQDSTQEIQQLIENLNGAVAQAISVVESSQVSAEDSEKKVLSAIDSLGLIAQRVGDMNDLNVQIATAVEQQGSVSQDINRNIVQISDSAEHVLNGANLVSSSAEALSKEANDLTNMILRFKLV